MSIGYYSDSSFNTNVNDVYKVGGEVFVGIKWSVESLVGQLGFFIESCSISRALNYAVGKGVFLVKNSCYSSALYVQPVGSKLAETTAGFSYRTFLFDGPEEQDQLLSCNIR